MSDDALSPEEAQLIKEFREQMGSPEVGGRQQVEVIHESLGSTPQGHKIQFQPGNGKPYQPALRGQERAAARAARVREAMEASQARLEKNRQTILKQVDAMKRRIDGRNATETVMYIESLSGHDREVAVLAEELTQNRATVLRGAGMNVSNRIREQYQSELEVAEEAAKC